MTNQLKNKHQATHLPQNKEPTLRLTTRPNDANPNGDIFGGWLMSQIDIAGAIAAVEVAQGPVATIAVKELQFLNPLYIHDLVSFYPEVIRVGTSSVSVVIEVYAQRRFQHKGEAYRIADAEYVYVAIKKPGEKRVVPRKDKIK